MARNTLICWAENGEKRWDMIQKPDMDGFLLGLLENTDVDNHTIFIIPTDSFVSGIWLWYKTHKSNHVDFWNFFEDFGTVYEPPQINEKHQKIADEIHEKSSDDTKYGWISPEGKYFHCCWQGHSSLADRICFGMVETHNAERYLEEHGWCKIYKPWSENTYSVYVGGKHTITHAQMQTLFSMGLDKADGVSEMLSKA